MTRKIKESKENEGNVGALFEQKMEMLEGENKQLRSTVKVLEMKLEEKEGAWKEEKMKLEKQINSLEKTLEKKSK